VTAGAGWLDFPSAAGVAGDGDGDASDGNRMIVEAGGKPLESGFGRRGVCAEAVAAQDIAMDMQTTTRRSIGILRGTTLSEAAARPSQVPRR
jgi:hypothetical protein